MDYKNTYTEEYFNGKDSFFYSLGYGKFQGRFFTTMYSWLTPYIKTFKHGRVLDVGCAYGLMLEKFPKLFEKYGLDVSEYAIAEARKRLGDAMLKVGEAEDFLPFPDDYFDVVICNDVIEHLEQPIVALQNIKRVLKKGGILYLSTPNLTSLRKKLFARADIREHHISMMASNELKGLLENLGFTILSQYTYTGIPFLFLIKIGFNLGLEQAYICKKI